MKRFRYYRVIFYLFLAIVMYQIPLEWVESRRLCIWYHLFQVDCFGCRFTRAFFSLVNGQFEKAFFYHKLVIVVPVVLAIIGQDFWMILSRSKKQSWLEVVFTQMISRLYPNLRVKHI